MSSGIPLANLFSLTDPFGPPSPLAPLSDTRIDHRVLALAGLLQVVQQPPDLRVGVREEAGVDLGHPAEQPLLLGRQRVPRPRAVQRRERLAVRPRARLGRADRVQRRQLGVGRDDAHLLLARERLLAHRLIAHVEPALEAVDPLLRGVVRRVTRARRVVEEERLLGREHLGVLDELQRLVGHVLGEVVALLRRARRVDGMAVVDQLRDTTGWSRRRGTRRSARSPGRSASCAATRRGSSRPPGTDATCRPCTCSSRARRGSAGSGRSRAGSRRWRSGTRSPPR